MDPKDERFIEHLLQAGRTEQPSATLAELGDQFAELGGAKAGRRPPRPRNWLLTACAGLSVASAAAWALTLNDTSLIDREPVPHSAGEPHPAPQIFEKQRALLAPALVSGDPCTKQRRAAGRWPVIDDFEDDDDFVLPLEGRRGHWRWVRDTDAEDTAQVLFSTTRPQASAENRRSLHVKGGTHDGWGASVELRLDPGCYDASVYGGIGLSIAGPAEIELNVRSTDDVLPQWGGTCEANCYRSKHVELQVGASFQRVEVHWGELADDDGERGFDPSRLYGISLRVYAEDTPYEFWVDDVEFLPR